MPAATPSVETDVPPTFTNSSRNTTRAALELWNSDDITQQQHAIAEQLNDGSVPCDRRRPAELLTRFRSSTAAGSPR